MAAWRLARSLGVLRAQIDKACPHRKRGLDGTIGDKAHQQHASDHNPDNRNPPVVCALDITHDPTHGCDCNAIVLALVKSRDSRIKYIIWRRRIIFGAPRPKYPNAWVWYAYDGINAHSEHMHLSVYGDERGDDVRVWRV